MTAEACRVRMDLSYDGGGFSGWARQPGQRTVQQVLEDALSLVLRADSAGQLPVRLTVAGRTDAGVHARGQVAHADLPRAAWLDAAPVILRRLARLLPARCPGPPDRGRPGRVRRPVFRAEPPVLLPGLRRRDRTGTAAPARHPLVSPRDRDRPHERGGQRCCSASTTSLPSAAAARGRPPCANCCPSPGPGPGSRCPGPGRRVRGGRVRGARPRSARAQGGRGHRDRGRVLPLDGAGPGGCAPQGGGGCPAAVLAGSGAHRPGP